MRDGEAVRDMGDSGEGGDVKSLRAQSHKARGDYHKISIKCFK